MLHIIKQVIRQGCVASHNLFVLYTEMIMRSIVGKGGIRLGWQCDQQLDRNRTELQQLMNIVVQESEIKGLYLNCTSPSPWCFPNQSNPLATSEYTENAATKSTDSSIRVACSHQMEDTSKMGDVELALQN